MSIMPPPDARCAECGKPLGAPPLGQIRYVDDHDGTEIARLWAHLACAERVAASEGAAP